MDEFLKNLGSTSWWLSVMVAGVVASLLASYMRNWVDAVLSRVSTRWKNKSDKRATERLITIDRLQNNVNEKVLFAFEVQDHKLNAIFAFVLSDLMISLYYFRHSDKPDNSAGTFELVFRILLVLIGIALWFVGLKALTSALDKRDLLQEARRSRHVERYSAPPESPNVK